MNATQTQRLAHTWADRAMRAAKSLQTIRVPTTDGMQVNRADVIYARSYLRMIPALADRIIALRSEQADRRDIAECAAERANAIDPEYAP